MTHATLLLAAVCLLRGQHDDALIVVLVALTFAVLRLQPGRYAAMWRRSIAEHEATLFSGRADDEH